ncbi:acyl-CoA dehydrogenase family protein [Gemmata sp. JC717]|uniref:acyl-CoA dehydrogenase family protein n=1 Tax=Gemmata algarum TaxID=2975278 RepID=UPI0021BA7DEE|nr:acyl-CoA dehydrogenase family protein [Gemmata algarum]MDY3555025.1 acyl-CoA dehydrogenase family protein [Gemmata algarum]
MLPLPADVLERLGAGAESADRSADWPQASWDALRPTGVLAWAVPSEYGGAERGPVACLRAGEALGSACLTTAFTLSQREAAVRLLLKGPAPLQRRYLPGLATGSHFMTVGLSQLTTSRQHQGPALTARPAGGVFVLDGDIPWVTGADRAVAIVIGATLPDASQLLVVLPTDRAGVTVGPPLPLAALVGSRTSLVQCRGVVVEPELILAGPTESVLGKGGGGGPETSALALGLAAAAANYLRQEAAKRPVLMRCVDRLESLLTAARSRLHALAGGPPSDAVLTVRVECTKLVLRTTQTALLIAKGAGFVAPHAVQRWARQAMFFLVWSCPRPVAEGILEDLLPGA